MPEPIRIFLTVQDDETYKCYKFKNGYSQFTVKACDTGLHIGLFTEDNISQDTSPANPEYVIKVASQRWVDSQIELYKEGIFNSVQTISYPHVLPHEEWKGFWVLVSNGSIMFGKENECEPIINWKDINLKPIVKLGFLVEPHYYLNDVEERCGEADIVLDTLTKSRPTGVSWIKCSYGQKPDNAVIGGHDSGNPVYVIRSLIQRALTPGKLRQGTEYAEVSWNCKENRMDKYEVLANFDGDWVKAKEDKIPALALLAGRSEDNYPLYIGRTTHNGTITVGKVQPNHKALYISYSGEELAFKEYEILCHKPPGLSTIPHPFCDGDIKKQNVKWVYSCNGRIPRNAFVIGSHEGHSIVLIRTNWQGIWYPGWLCSADLKVHVSYHYYEKETDEYEVLCDFKGHWENPVDLAIPKNALIMCKIEEDEIYVGRFWHKGQLFCGPVRNMICIVWYNDELLQKEHFEILCHPNEVKSATKNGLKNFRVWDL